jgi:hypothetical protein
LCVPGHPPTPPVHADDDPVSLCLHGASGSEYIWHQYQSRPQFGPAIVSGNFDGWWIYWVAPVLGTVAAIFACSFLASRIEVAKVYHFDSDRSGVFRVMSRSAAH